MNKISLDRVPMKTILFFSLVVLMMLLAYAGYHQNALQEKTKSGGEDEKKEMILFSGNRGQAFKTNSWFSSIYKGALPSAPLFALPGAYQFRSDGLALGFPRPVATPNTVFGSFDPLCTVGTRGTVTGVEIARYGDWDAHFAVKSGESSWQVHMAQGSPVVAIDQVSDELILRCLPGVTVSLMAEGILLNRGNERMLVQAKGTGTYTQNPDSPLEVSLSSPVQSYRVLLLPQQTTNPVAFFATRPWNTILDTEANSEEGRDNVVRTTYAFRGEENEGSILTTLWPHHRSNSGGGEVLGTYETVLGTFQLIETSSFTTVLESPVPAPSFEVVTDPVAIEAIRQGVREDVIRFQKATPETGVYFFGTWLGGLASVAQIAELYGMEQEKNELLDILEKYLLASLSNFIYEADTQMLIAKNTEFGNEEGNDHHFHYGYYLRASAVLATLRPSTLATLEPTMNELAGDIATTDRASTRYPYLRNFSPYNGHSWADGDAAFADGNNQESTSEALNAWYAVSLWGQATKNDTLQRTGRALFALELASTKAYWFGENNPFPAGYEHNMAALVWGGKRDYATWFSGQAMHIHGIEWLPITPASSYLGTLPNFKERNNEILRAHPNPSTHEWSDLYTAHLSYFDPEQAARLLPVASKNQAMKSTALLYQTVYQNLERGR
jgi:hypothetical protein